MLEGRGLRQGDTNALLVNNTLAARDPRFRVGNDVTLRLGHRQVSWQVVGVTREPFSPALGYIPLGHLEELGGQRGMASSLRLVLERQDPASISAVKASLDQNLEREGVRAQTSLSNADRRVGFDEHMRMIYVFLIVMSGVLAAVGGLGLMTSMSLNVLERRREMGVLRAIGASPRTVWRIVVAEAVATASLSWALAALVAWPFSRTLADLLVRTVPHPPGLRLRAVGAAGVARCLRAAGDGRQPASGLARIALPGAGSDRLRVRRVRPCREMEGRLDGRSRGAGRPGGRWRRAMALAASARDAREPLRPRTPWRGPSGSSSPDRRAGGRR